MSPAIRLSVAIVTRNRPENLRRCLTSLRAQSVQPAEIVISDDSDLPETSLAIAQEFGALHVAGPRRGLYANRNTAALACAGSHIRTADDDHTFPEGHLETCLAAVSSDPASIWTTGEIGYVDGAFYGTAATAAQLHPSGLGGPVEDANDNWAIADGSTIYPAAAFQGERPMVEDFVYGSSYLEFGAYLYRQGMRSRCIPGAFVEHHATRETLVRGESAPVVASWLFASLCFNLHFRPNRAQAMKYALANLAHSPERLRLLGSLPGIARTRPAPLGRTIPEMKRDSTPISADTAQEYDAWHRSVHAGPATPPTLAQWHEDALSLAPGLAGKRVLEVGCGSGEFALHLAGLGAEVTAIDFSTAAIDFARDRAAAAGAHIRFDTADAQSMPFANKTFEIVFSCECLEHLPNPAAALSEMARVLAPGGRLILTTENYSNGMLLAWIVAWWRGVPFNSGVHVQPIEQFFLYWRVKKMMRVAGFRPLRMIGAHHVFLLLPRLHPHTFVRERFRSPFWAKIFRPLARHVSFEAIKSGPI